MIDPELAKAIVIAHNSGMSKRAIGKQFNVSRATVRRIITNAGASRSSVRKLLVNIERDLLERLYRECQGYKQRIHERLESEYNIHIPYSTLTHRIRHLGIGQTRNDRAFQVDDEPGKEMQHDTSPYRLDISGKKTPLIASLIYLRYSKKRYLKFYPAFNRFRMKCFLHEALTYWGYCAKVCIIDNTNLAVHSGSGRNALINDEMQSFSKQFGFEFIAHEIKHSDRKAGNERSFWTVETNFFPGRIFKSLEDLNHQAFHWACEIMEKRPLTKKQIIPSQAFEEEKSSLIKLTAYLPRPYQVHQRLVDQYGYIAFNGNLYWVPSTAMSREIKVLEFDSEVTLYSSSAELVAYATPACGVKNERIYPQDLPSPPHRPKVGKIKPSTKEQQELRLVGVVVSNYLDFILDLKGIRQHQFIRGLYHHFKKLPEDVFVKTVSRALSYKVSDMESIERISIYYLNSSGHKLPTPEINLDYQNRGSYLDGEYSEGVDLNKFTAKEDHDYE